MRNIECKQNYLFVIDLEACENNLETINNQ